MKFELQQMLKQRTGVIINTASILGTNGAPLGASAYIASKHGVVGLTKAAALEHAQNNIRVNAVSPGPIDTRLLREWNVDASGDYQKGYQQTADRVPMRRIGQTEEVARAVLWLAADESSFVTGAVVETDGGQSAA